MTSSTIHGCIATTARARRQLARCIGLAALPMSVLSQAGTLAQGPLVHRLGTPPPANVVLTVDDSGSMNAQFLPEGTFKRHPDDPDAWQIRFPSATVDRWWTWYMTDGFPGDTSKDDGWVPACVAPALSGPAETVYQMQFRSPDVNRLYYNPDVTYRPWMLTTHSRMPPATPEAPLWDPNKPGHYDSLTAEVTQHASGSLNWCPAHDTVSNRHGEVCTGEPGAQKCAVPFRPGLVYRLQAQADPTLGSSFRRFDLNVAGQHAPALKHPDRTDCLGSGCTQAEEQQNFANWFTYHRTRLQVTKAALSEALARSAHPLRLALGSLNQGQYAAVKPPRVIDGQRQNVLLQGVREATAAHRDELLVAVRALTAAGGTPLPGALQAVTRYFQRADDGNPWQNRPLDGSGPEAQLACRRATHVLMADGPASAAAVPPPGNVDSTALGPRWPVDPALPVPGAPYGYQAQAPFADDHADTLADQALQAHLNDLRPDLPNRVPPDRSLPRAPYWQHLTHDTVALGWTGLLDARTEPVTDGQSPRARTLAGLTAGTLTWPDPAVSDAARADDLWHAAVNTGGEHWRVLDGRSLTAAWVGALDRASIAPLRAAGVTASGASLQAGALKFVPTYEPGRWSGDLLDHERTVRAGVTDFNPVPKWAASQALPAWNSRNSHSWDGDATVRFDRQMDAATKALISAEPMVQDRLIDYLRGDSSNEGTADGQFRHRAGRRLPDFLGATPLYVKGLLDQAYPDAWTPSEPYSGFVAAKRARARGAVWLGGGGGMLHAFADSDGRELFAYVPRAVLGHLALLARQDYGSPGLPHRYFVAGGLAEADAYLPSPRDGGRLAWANLLTGAFGAGAPGVFVLDVTDLGALGDGSVRLERSQQDDPDMGHVFQAPEVGRLAGQWFLFHGNGAHSQSGRAALMAVNLTTGQSSKIVLESDSGRNGLMGLRLLIHPASREVEAAYAGDLQGNLWRVDFGPAAARSAEPAHWQVSFGGQPLLVARSHAGERQPITARPALARHPTGKGRMVLFGTGQLHDDDDPDRRDMQTFYAVHDATPDGASAATTDLTDWAGDGNHRSRLQQQLIDTTPQPARNEVTGELSNFYRTSQYPIDWQQRRGWFLDLSLPDGLANAASAGGQRVITEASVVGDFVWISSLVPGAPPDACGQSRAQGYHFWLPAATGAMHDQPVLDTNGDARVDGADSIAAGVAADAEGGQMVMAPAAPPGEHHDQSVQWMQADRLLTAKALCLHRCARRINDRIWQQLLDPPQPD
jgi:type IV pilus assembly protein PilY1